MADTAPPNNNAEAAQRMQSLSLALRHIGVPLLTALADTARSAQENGEKRPGFEVLPNLIDSAADVARRIADGAQGGEAHAGLRLSAAAAASQLVAANYRAQGVPPDEAALAPLWAVIGALPEKCRHLVGDPALPNDAATFRAKMLEALVPVVGAVAQYSFGRGEHGLLAEIAERLVRIADRVTRTLAASGSTPEQWRILCWAILKAGGQIYADSHYAEADRLLYMSAEERAAYFARHGNIVPMTNVWQDFDQRMALLATLGAYLDLPAVAEDAATAASEGWR